MRRPTSPSVEGEISPLDAHNRALLENVHPSGWKNPTPADCYNLVVIGAGTGGLVTAAGAAGLGARVALIERSLMGGDCLNFGCVPSKTLIHSARVMSFAAKAKEFGIEVPPGARANFAAVMERVRRVRAQISEHDSARRFAELGIDVFLGEGCFVRGDSIKVGESVLRFKRAVIATGARAVVPQIDGLREGGFLTNETVFNLTELPRRLAVIGGGPIGSELAQAFCRLGSTVTLFHKNDHILDREDEDAARLMQNVFEREGVRLIVNARLERVEARAEEKVIHYAAGSERALAVVDEILVATGRLPNVSGLGLEKAGVKFDAREGVLVDDCLRTANPRVYAVGDVCMKWKFTHAADAAARIVIQNALFVGRKKLSRLNMPWCTYTTPEVAHVGLSEGEARRRGVVVDTYVQAFDKVDRAIAEGQEEGFVKILTRRGSGEIVGATIVADHAGDLISEISVAMAAGFGLGKLANVIHPYPTQAEAIRKCGDAYNRRRLTPGVKKVLGRWLKWRR